MRLDGRRDSGNIVDRRGGRGKVIGIGGGIAGVIIAAVITLLSGGDLSDVARNVMQTLDSPGYQTSAPVREDAEEEALYQLSSKVLAGTEDAWSKIFREQGWGEYRPPKMVRPDAGRARHRSGLSIARPTRRCILILISSGICSRRSGRRVIFAMLM